MISEIMYHPVDEQTDDDQHEFVELANRTQSAVDLSGWTLRDESGALSFTFPLGTTLAAGRYAVVAKSREALATTWGLDTGNLFGDYTGGLDNGGEWLTVVDSRGDVSDSVKYDDAPPWPTAADALGVGEDWLPQAERPISKHRYKGRSLERISLDGPSNEPANWEASALDAVTPGRANGVAGTIYPVVVDVSWAPSGSDGHLVGPDDRVTLSFAISPPENIPRAELRYFVDDVTRSDEAIQSVPLKLDGAGRYTIELPAQAENSLVRYQLWAERAGTMKQVFPRATDPLAWRSYFVTPAIATSSRVYHLFIAPESWSKLEASLAGSDVKDCAPSADWNADYPATFIYNGDVYDVVASYSGSRYQRPDGATIASWPYPGPRVANGSTFKALSWKIKFPRSQRFEQQRAIKLNKMYQGFPGVNSIVESQLLTKAGLPSYQVRFARMHVNGGYYHYFAEMEDINEDMLQRFAPDGEPVGDIFKVDGDTKESGLLARGDFAPPRGGQNCPNVSASDRYAAIYPRINYEYRGPTRIIELITELDKAMASGVVSDAVKGYFHQYWDVDLLLKAFAIRNWCGVWDDTFHNVFPYRRSDGKWVLLQQDFDWDFGLGSFGAQPELGLFRADQTLYIGAYQGSAIGQTCELDLSAQQRSRCNNLGFSRLKNAFIQNFRTEFDATLRSLAKNVLDPDTVSRLIDESAALFSEADWNAAPAAKSFCGADGTQPCSFRDEVSAMKRWSADRHALLLQRLGP